MKYLNKMLTVSLQSVSGESTKLISSAETKTESSNLKKKKKVQNRK